MAATVQVRGRRLDPVTASSITTLMKSNNISMKAILEDQARKNADDVKEMVARTR